jgi:formate hydrogenlyase transcriptional activator
MDEITAQNLTKPDIPDEIKIKWHRIVDLMARIACVPAGLIMKVDPPQLVVFLSSKTRGNPYKEGDRSDLDSGFYSETVIKKRAALLVPDALQDPQWNHNPDIELGMTYYMGLPLEWPDGEIFGTICLLGGTNYPLKSTHKELVTEFRHIVESDLRFIFETAEREALIADLHQYRDQLHELVDRRTAEYEERLRFERLISDLSAKFINIPANRIEDEIEKALEQIRQFFKVDRCTLLEFSPDKLTARVLQAVLTANINPLPPTFNMKDLFPWTHDTLIRQAKLISFLSPDDLPAKAKIDKQTFSSIKSGSQLILPIIFSGSVDYAVSIATVRKYFEWPREYIPRLRLMAEIILSVLEKTLAEQKLKETEAEYRTLANTTYDWVYWRNPDGTLRYVSPSSKTITGYTPHEFIKKPDLLEQIILPQDRQIWEKHLQEKGQEEGHSIQYRIIRKDGTIVWIDHGSRRVHNHKGEHIGDRASNRDVTARKMVEVELIKSQRRLTEAQRIAHLGNWDWNIKTNELFWSEEIYNIFGFDPEDFGATYAAFLQSVHPDDRKALTDAVDMALADPSYNYSIDHRVIRPDGAACIVHEQGEVFFSPEGKPVRMIGTVQDITKSKQMEKILEIQLEEIQALKQQLETENIYLRQEINLLHTHEEIIGQSKALRKVLKQVEQVAPTNTVVLIQGETGTGKELVARAIHNLSKRKDRVMVVVNCASLPSALVESELFGREKGAYTGALSKQAGRFEIAHGSTILLDEIGELSHEVQAKLLRVLQDGYFERLGSPKPVKVDVRVIAATNRDLTEEVRRGRFREDLYYRLNVFPIKMPPLRARTDDIPLLTWSFINEFSNQLGKKITSVPKKVMELLTTYSWPGNIRELRNVIEQAVIISDGTLNVRLPRDSFAQGTQITTLQEAEQRHIMQVLERTGWRIKGRSGAAEILGLKPSTLYTKMKKLGIPNRKEKVDIPS